MEGGALVRNAEFLRFASHWASRRVPVGPTVHSRRVRSSGPWATYGAVYGRECLNDADLDHQRRLWLDRTANVRIHGTTHERPQVRFERDERLLLQPLAAQPYYSLVFDNEHEAMRPRSRRVRSRMSGSGRSPHTRARRRCSMKPLSSSRRDRLRHILADLKNAGRHRSPRFHPSGGRRRLYNGA
jgi:hypothetical protein